MKCIFKLLLTIVLIGLSFSVTAQNDGADNEVIYVVPKSYPMYPGGESELYRFIIANLRMPEAAMQQGIEGRVIVRFDIDTAGSVQNIETIEDIGGGCAEEVIRLLELMPKWEPARSQSGKAIRWTMTLPVNFTLPDSQICEEERKTAESGEAKDIFLYAQCLYNYPSQRQSAVAKMKALGKEGYAPAQYTLGTHYAFHRKPFLPDSAIYWYSQAVESADNYYTDNGLSYSSVASMSLGMIYEELGKNEMARRYYHIAAQKGHFMAPAALGLLYIKQNNLDSAEFWIGESVKKGVSEGVDTLALCFFNQGNYTKAVYWYAQDLMSYGDELRSQREFYIMGLQYEFGVGVGKDKKKAREYYEQATFFDEAEEALKRMRRK